MSMCHYSLPLSVGTASFFLSLLLISLPLSAGQDVTVTQSTTNSAASPATKAPVLPLPVGEGGEIGLPNSQGASATRTQLPNEVPTATRSLPADGGEQPLPRPPFKSVRKLYFMSPEGLHSIRTDGTDEKLIAKRTSGGLEACTVRGLDVKQDETEAVVTCDTKVFKVDLSSKSPIFEPISSDTDTEKRDILYLPDRPDTVLVGGISPAGASAVGLYVGSCRALRGKDACDAQKPLCMFGPGYCLNNFKTQTLGIRMQDYGGGLAFYKGDVVGSFGVREESALLLKAKAVISQQGQVQTKLNLVSDFMKNRFDFRARIGYPLVHGDTLYVLYLTEKQSYLAAVDADDLSQPRLVNDQLPPFMAGDTPSESFPEASGQRGVVVMEDFLIAANRSELVYLPMECVGCDTKPGVIYKGSGVLGPIVLVEAQPRTATKTVPLPSTRTSTIPSTPQPTPATATSTLPPPALPPKQGVTVTAVTGTVDASASGSKQTGSGSSNGSSGGSSSSGSTDDDEGFSIITIIISIIAGLCAFAMIIAFVIRYCTDKQMQHRNNSRAHEDDGQEMLLERGNTFWPGGAAAAAIRKLRLSSTGVPINPLIDLPHHDCHHDEPDDIRIELGRTHTDDGSAHTNHSQNFIYDGHYYDEESPNSRGTPLSPTRESHRSFSDTGSRHSGGFTTPNYEHHPTRWPPVPPRRYPHPTPPRRKRQYSTVILT